MLALDWARLLCRSIWLATGGTRSNPTADYDAAAQTYDAHYSRHLGQAAGQLLGKLPVSPGMHLVDVACGTGFFTVPLAQRTGAAGSVLAVDISAGMLERNRHACRAAELFNVRFVQHDALEHLAALPTACADGIVCGWGLCYIDHATFRRAVERILKPGGFLAVIENRADTLDAVSALFRKALLQHPNALVKHMQTRLPKDHHHLRQQLCRGALQAVDTWSDEVQVPCSDGQAVTDYMVKSGASAGFLDALAPARREQVLDCFTREADCLFAQGRPALVIHRYCALLARRA